MDWGLRQEEDSLNGPRRESGHEGSDSYRLRAAS
jgi:hypothetical protein